MKLIKNRLRNRLTELSLSNLMKIFIKSPEKLTDSDLEEIVDVWNRKDRRIAVYTLIQTLISLHMHTPTAHALCQALTNISNEFNNIISREGGEGTAAPPYHPPPPLPKWNPNSGLLYSLGMSYEVHMYIHKLVLDY